MNSTAQVKLVLAQERPGPKGLAKNKKVQPKAARGTDEKGGERDSGSTGRGGAAGGPARSKHEMGTTLKHALNNVFETHLCDTNAAGDFETPEKMLAYAKRRGVTLIHVPEKTIPQLKNLTENRQDGEHFRDRLAGFVVRRGKHGPWIALRHASTYRKNNGPGGSGQSSGNKNRYLLLDGESSILSEFGSLEDADLGRFESDVFVALTNAFGSAARVSDDEFAAELNYLSNRQQTIDMVTVEKRLPDGISVTAQLIDFYGDSKSHRFADWLSNLGVQVDRTYLSTHNKQRGAECGYIAAKAVTQILEALGQSADPFAIRHSHEVDVTGDNAHLKSANLWMHGDDEPTQDIQWLETEELRELYMRTYRQRNSRLGDPSVSLSESFDMGLAPVPVNIRAFNGLQHEIVESLFRATRSGPAAHPYVVVSNTEAMRDELDEGAGQHWITVVYKITRACTRVMGNQSRRRVSALSVGDKCLYAGPPPQVQSEAIVTAASLVASLAGPQAWVKRRRQVGIPATQLARTLTAAARRSENASTEQRRASPSLHNDKTFRREGKGSPNGRQRSKLGTNLTNL